MSWLKEFFGRNEDRALSPEATAAFEKIARFLADEDAQNERLPATRRDMLKKGLSCDQVPWGVGCFGKELTNPIPVNGPLGELIYLSNLRHISGQPVLFHRLGSLNAVDIYEIMTLDGKFWDILYLDFYHPRKSCSVPEGYSAAFDWTATFYGTNEFVEDFPKNIHIAVGQTFERLIGISMCLPEIREAVEGKEFLRPSEHARRSASLRREIAKHQSVNEYNLSPSAPSPSSPKPEPVADADEEMTVVSLAEGQERFAREIEALSDEDARDAHAALVSIVHQMARLEAGHGKPIALDEIEVFVRSFENYVNHLDELSSEKLEADYETVRRGIAATDGPSNLRHGAQALMVIILGEMIRREGVERGAHDMSGYERAFTMMERLDRTFTRSDSIGEDAPRAYGEELEKPIHLRTVEALDRIGMSAEKYRHIGDLRDAEIASMTEDDRALFLEQLRLFAEVEKRSETLSSLTIYLGAGAMMEVLERAISKREAPPKGGSLVQIRADIVAFADALLGADDHTLMELDAVALQASGNTDHEFTSLAGMVTRVVTISVLLRRRLSESFPICLHEAEWIMTALLADLENLAQKELKATDDSAIG